MSYTDSTRTVMDVQRQVKRTFGDESGVQLEDADIFMWINDAQDEIVNRNKVLKGTAVVSSVIGQKDYTFPALPIHQVESLHYDNQLLRNLAFSTAQEQLLSNDATATSGDPILWYEWGGKFSLYPTPATVKTITLYLTLRPARVALATDKLSVPDKYFQNIVAYVLQKAYAMDEDWNAQQALASQFDSSLNEMGEEERTAVNMTFTVVQMVD